MHQAARRAGQEHAGASLPVGRFEPGTMRARSLALHLTEKRMPADKAVRWSHGDQQWFAAHAHMPEPAVFDQTAAMNADRRKHQVAGGAADPAPCPGPVHGSAHDRQSSVE